MFIVDNKKIIMTTTTTIAATNNNNNIDVKWPMTIIYLCIKKSLQNHECRSHISPTTPKTVPPVIPGHLPHKVKKALTRTPDLYQRERGGFTIPIGLGRRDVIVAARKQKTKLKK